ncbi:MAG: tRNA pseudouridine(38-40) synthase TruA [Clostridiales bacterium]|nr:tRNA pseudouridine(38-40) synthase TruA [Clostridiales bacterium]
MYPLAIVTEYDGTAFVGFQIQSNGRSVQEVLNGALSKLYKTEINITGCSRTDSGVHARGHVSSLNVPFYIPEEKIPLAVNQFLPDDVCVRKAFYTKEGFSARFDSLGKRYIYRIYTGDVRSPLHARYSYFTSYRPDMDLMREAASVMVGEHDFAAFCASGSSAVTTVRKINSVDVRYSPCDPDLIEIEVIGEAFLYNMVRIMAGTILYAGIGKISKEDIKDALTSPSRAKTGKTLPPQGLTLEEVYYGDDIRAQS